jgi:hypothetical protein
MVLQIDFEQGWSDAWQRVAAFIPKFVAFLLILVIGYFVAKLLARVVDRILQRVGFDGWVERGGFRQALAKSKYDPSDILAMVVFWAVFLFVLQLAFGVFGPNPISELIQGVIAYLPKIFVAIVILVIAGALARAATDILGSMLSGVSGGTWMARGAGVAILVIGVFAALNQLEIAPEIVNGLFYALLAIVVGSAIVAVGGGGIRTMQRYWERSATRLEAKSEEVRQEVRRQQAAGQPEPGPLAGEPTEATVDLTRTDPEAPRP